MKKKLIYLMGLPLFGVALALPKTSALMVFGDEGTKKDTDNSYLLSYYDDFNGSLKDGWSYVKGGSSYSYVEGEAQKYGWLFNGQDHIQYKRNNNPTDFGKFLYGDSSSSNYVFELKVRADTELTAGQYVTTYGSELGKHLTINSMLPFFVQNSEPSSAYQTFYGRGVCFTNYAVGFWEYDNEGKGAWASSARLNVKLGNDFTWADWHNVRVLANEEVCKLFIDETLILETAQSSFKKATATSGPCGFNATINSGYDSLHYDDFKFYEANPNYTTKITPTSTLDLLDKTKFTSTNAKMNYSKNGNKVGFSIPTGGAYGTQLTTINQEYASFDMDIAVDMDNQLALKGTTAEDKTTKNLRVSAESGIVIGAANATLNSNYYMVSTELIQSNSAYVNKSNISLYSYTKKEGGSAATAKKLQTLASVPGTSPYLRLSLKDKKLSVTVFANKADYEANKIAKTVSDLDVSAISDGNHFGFRCNTGGTNKFVYEAEILSFSSSDKGAVEYPSKNVEIAPETVGGPYTVTIPTLTNGTIKEGETVITSNITMNAHENKTLKIIPNEGYSISRVLLNGKNIGPKTEIKIENITRNTTIDVDFISSSSIDVYLIAGQSNAAGYTPINGLFKSYTYGESVNQPKVDEYQNGYDNIYYYGATKINDIAKGNMDMDIVRMGNGNAASFMGPELGFAEYSSPILASQNQRAALVKYAIGGTGFANSTSDTVSTFGNWLSPTSLVEEESELVEKSGLLYKNLLEVTKSSLIDLVNRGFRPVVKGLMWFQGCADAGSKTISENYAHHLTNLINDLRKDVAAIETELSLDKGYLHVVAGKINDNLTKCEYEGIVREQTQLVSETLDGVRIIDTKGMIVPDVNDNNDPWHFSSKDMLKIGNMFGQALMEENNYVTPETYTIRFEDENGELIHSENVKKWSSIKLPETPTKEGYSFLKWVMKDADTEINYKDYSVTSDLTLVAKFQIVPAYEEYLSFLSLVNSALKLEGEKIKKPTSEEWASLKNAYTALEEKYQTTIKNGAALKDGNDLEKALFLYDSVINEFGPDEFENFLSRPTSYVPPTPPTPPTSEDPVPSTSKDPTPSSSTETSSSQSSSSFDIDGDMQIDQGGSNTGIIVGVSIAVATVAIAGVGIGIYFFKKRK